MAKKETVLSVLQDIRNILKPSGIVAVIKSDRFTMLKDGWVRDNLLGIDWSLEDKKMSWNQAKKEGINLPTTKQLETLIDRTKFNPAIIEEAKILKLKTDDWYWAVEPYLNPVWSGGAWVVGFGYGGVDGFNKGSNGYVRPVRPSK